MVCPLPFLLLLFFFFYLFTLLPFKNINQAKYPVLVKLSFFVSFARFVFFLYAPSSLITPISFGEGLGVRLIKH